MRAMRMLLLGGTVFVGRALTDAALARGHEVTHLHRGRSAPPDPRVETLRGDRTVEPFPGAAAARAWDAVIDTSGYLPQVVARSASALRASGRYAFVSSISVYAGMQFGEDAPVREAPAPLPEAWTPETYGGLKAACESVVRATFADRALIVRPGLIAGPHDPTDRFTWWPERVARGGAVAAPGRPGRRVQLIDARDLASWMIAALERGAHGTYNATGPACPVEMGALLEACRTRHRQRRHVHVDGRGVPRARGRAAVAGDAPVGAGIRSARQRIPRRADRAGTGGGARLPAAGRDHRGHARLVAHASAGSRLESGTRRSARAGAPARLRGGP